MRSRRPLARAAIAAVALTFLAATAGAQISDVAYEGSPLDNWKPDATPGGYPIDRPVPAQPVEEYLDYLESQGQDVFEGRDLLRREGSSGSIHPDDIDAIDVFPLPKFREAIVRQHREQGVAEGIIELEQNREGPSWSLPDYAMKMGADYGAVKRFLYRELEPDPQLWDLLEEKTTYTRWEVQDARSPEWAEPAEEIFRSRGFPEQGIQALRGP